MMMNVSHIKTLLKQDLDDIYHKGQLETLDKFESLKGNLSGVVVAANDVSPIEHSVECTVGSKNLFGLTYEDFKNTNNLGEGKQVFFTLKPNTSYTLSSNMYRNQDGATNIWFNGTSGRENGVWENNSSTTITDNNGKLYILLRETKLEEIFNNYWVQLEENSTATEYTPYVNFDGNLFDGVLISGIYNDVNMSMSSVNSTVYRSFSMYLEKGTYTLSANEDLYIVRTIKDEVFSSTSIYAPYTFTVEQSGTVGFSFRLSDESDWDDSIIVKLNEGTSYINKVTCCGRNLCKELSTENIPSLVYRRIVFDYLPKGEYTIFSPDISLHFYAFDGCQASTYKKDADGVQYGVCFNVLTGGSISVGFRRTDETLWVDGTKVMLIQGNIEYSQFNSLYEDYKGQTFIVGDNEIVEGIKSISPNMTLLSNNGAVSINANYYKDPDIVISNLQQAVALTGGE